MRRKRRPNRRPDPRRIRKHRSYTVAEAAEALSVHRNTVRNWLRGDLQGLRTTAGVLILAGDLHAFLGKRTAASKSPLPPGTMYCLRCRAPRRPPPDLVELISTTPTRPNLRGLCPVCGSLMHRRIGAAGPAAAGFVLPEQASARAPSR